MPPLILEGETLGERHRYYNQLLKDAVDSTAGKLKNVNYDDNDIDNFLKIDIACNKRNIEYILEVLKGEDLLYVSRTLKRCAWLVTEPQHAHIVNPHHLHQHLFPHMTTKATNKLLLHIRIHLKEEKRVKAFYLYINNINPKAALKWLPNCPIQLILEVVKQRGEDLPLYLFRRLAKRSPDVLGIYNHSHNYTYNKRDVFKNAQCMLKKYTSKILDVADSIWIGDLPSFGKKCTQIILKKCPHRITNMFRHYSQNNFIHLPTFVDYIIKNEGAKNYLLRHSHNETQYWFKFDVLKYFLDKIPREETLDLLKTIFKIDSKSGMADVFFAIEKDNHQDAANVYRWYQFMPFRAAKYDLQKLIYAESSAEVRQSILSVFLACASQNAHHVRTVLQYYHDRHINEPYKFKIPFVINLLDTVDVHKFNDDTWNLLNNLFHSMEVYIESDNDVTHCIYSIIIYKVLRDENVPEIVAQKFKFDTLYWYRRKLNKEENEKIFTYLFNYLMTKLQKQNLRNETELNEAMTLLKHLWTLLKSYKKEQQYYQIVVDRIIELLEIKKKISSTVDLASLYTMMGRWRRHLFPESLSLCKSEEVCLNILKHAPRLLTRYYTELNTADAAALRLLLTKLRIYWPHTIGQEWTEKYLARINSATTMEHKDLVKGLYTLLSSVNLTKFMEAKAPINKTIHWSEVNEIEMSLRRHIAKNMHLARPHLPTDLILKYANGDYLQYSQLSLYAIFHNLSTTQFREYIPLLLDAPVALKKHGIRLAFGKFKPVDLINIFGKIWNSTTNRRVREILFTLTFDLLCKERKTALIKQIWNLLNTYIDQLTHKENFNIYYTLHKVSDVPLCTRVEYYVKSYHFLKSLPDSCKCKFIFGWIVDYAVEIMEYLDPGFVRDVLLDSAYDKYLNAEYSYLKIMSAYLLFCKDYKTQIQRYNLLLKPILEQDIAQNEKEHVRSRIEQLLKFVCDSVPNFVFGKKLVVPVELIKNMSQVLATTLDQNDYVKVTSWKLTVAFLKLIDDLNQTENDYTWDSMVQKLVPNLGDLLQKQLEEDLNKHFSLIYLIFADSCQMFFRRFSIDTMVIMNVIELLLRNDMVETHIIGLRMLPFAASWEKEKKEKKNLLCRKIYWHPSPEVKMHYLHAYAEIPDLVTKNMESGLPTDTCRIFNVEDNVAKGKELGTSHEEPTKPWCTLL